MVDNFPNLMENTNLNNQEAQSIYNETYFFKKNVGQADDKKKSLKQQKKQVYHLESKKKLTIQFLSKSTKGV